MTEKQRIRQERDARIESAIFLHAGNEPRRQSDILQDMEFSGAIHGKTEIGVATRMITSLRKEGRIPKSLKQEINDASKYLDALLDEKITEFVLEMHPVGVRQVQYAMVAQGHIQKSEMQRVANRLTYLRENDFLDWRLIVDAGRDYSGFAYRLGRNPYDYYSKLREFRNETRRYIDERYTEVSDTNNRKITELSKIIDDARDNYQLFLKSKADISIEKLQEHYDMHRRMLINRILQFDDDVLRKLVDLLTPIEPSSFEDLAAEYINVDTIENYQSGEPPSTYDFIADTKHHMQPYYREIWVEKLGLLESVIPAVDGLDCPVIGCKGQASISLCRAAAEHFDMIAETRNQKIKVFYIGDHDRAGYNIFHAVKDKLNRYTSDDTIVECKRLGIDDSHIDEFHLPYSTDEKECGVSTAGDVVERSVLLDAYPLPDLRSMLRNAVNSLFEENAVAQAEADGCAMFNRVHATYSRTRESIQNKTQKYNESLTYWYENAVSELEDKYNSQLKTMDALHAELTERAERFTLDDINHQPIKNAF